MKTNAQACTHTYIHVHTHTHACMHAHMQGVHTHTHTHTHIKANKRVQHKFQLHFLVKNSTQKRVCLKSFLLYLIKMGN